MLHSDQGSQFTSEDWQAFLKAHGMVCRRAAAEIAMTMPGAEFFKSSKRERIKRKKISHATKVDARADVFDYIEMFYNRKRKHGSNNMLAPVEFERQYFMRQQAV